MTAGSSRSVKRRPPVIIHESCPLTVRKHEENMSERFPYLSYAVVRIHVILSICLLNIHGVDSENIKY